MLAPDAGRAVDSGPAGAALGGRVSDPDPPPETVLGAWAPAAPGTNGVTAAGAGVGVADADEVPEPAAIGAVLAAVGAEAGELGAGVEVVLGTAM